MGIHRACLWVTLGAAFGVISAGCEHALAPRTLTRLEEIRRVAPYGYGAFAGVVRGLAAPDSIYCRAASPVLAGVRVDLGVWHDSPAVYRDTVTREPPSTLAEPRFEVIGFAMTDAAGQFRFERLPLRTPFAFRAIPPRDSPYRLGYGVSLYGIANVEIPTRLSLCLTPRQKAPK